MTTTLSPSKTRSAPEPRAALRRVALLGNPNAGKTTLFNALTGMRQKVGNYPGVTVERKEGRCAIPGGDVSIMDLPGTYSLSPKSPDEEVARDALLGLRTDTATPDVVIVVVDASNLERNLYLATQVIELGLPTIIALNMTDVARANGKPVNADKLSEDLGATVVPIVALRGEGVAALKEALSRPLSRPREFEIPLSGPLSDARTQLAATLPNDSHDDKNLIAASDSDASHITRHEALSVSGVALRLLCSDVPLPRVRERFGASAAETLAVLRRDPQLAPARATALEAVARYGVLSPMAARAIEAPPTRELSQSFTDRADKILTHRIWGMAIFAAIVLLVFQSIYSFAAIPMGWIDSGVSALGDFATTHLPSGPLRDMLVQGVIAGVGAVVAFIPQILILFFFIGLLEDTGYMARAAFLMDRLMSRVGLHGRSFIPLLSSFACAIPGVMATRTIASRRDRMTTILIAPLMACSARLPVYVLMIGTFIPDRSVGGLSLRAVTMFSLYVVGVLVAMAAAWVFKKTLFKGPPPPLMLELPPYKIPAPRNLLVTMWDRGSQFLKRAGTVILSISILLWFMLAYPRVNASQVTSADVREARVALQASGAAFDAATLNENALLAAQKRRSFAGRIGHFVEPTIAPLGFNWKIGVGLIGAMAAREVFVSTMGTVYAAGQNADEHSLSLREGLRADTWPDGRKVWSTATVLSILVWFVIAMQCVSTLAVVRRETNSWTWPLFMQVYMTSLAWIAAFVTYRVALMLGL